jgi:hypothetical protein
MTQELIAAVIVALAAAYVVWRYLPRRWRQELGRLHPGLASSPGCHSGSDGSDGCTSCSGCSSGGGAAAEAGAAKPVAISRVRR